MSLSGDLFIGLSGDLLFDLSSDPVGDLCFSFKASFELFLATRLSNEDFSTGDLDLCLLGCLVTGDLTGDFLFGDLDFPTKGDLSLSSDFRTADFLCFALTGDLSISGDFCFSLDLLGDCLLGDLDLEADLFLAVFCLSEGLLSGDLDFSGDLCRDLF